MLKKSLVLLVPLAILAGGWYFLQSQSLDSSNPDSTATAPAEAVSPSATSPFSETPDNTVATEKDDASIIVDAIPTDPAPNNANTNNANELSSQPATDNNVAIINSPGVDAAAVAVEPLTDEEFLRLEQQIKTDRQLRMQLLDEFRYNTDPARAKQLAALLGPYDDPAIVQTASELAYSGDLQSQIAGLDLLARVQTRNDEARNVAIDLLSSGNDPTLLVATMNVLATPARAATPGQRQLLNDNLGNLANHYDPKVRGQSLALIGRWDKNSAVARESLSRGLTDSDAAVRSRAAFAIKNIRNPDANMITGLLALAENTDDKKSARFAALSALEKMQLTGINLRRYNLAKRNINRR